MPGTAGDRIIVESQKVGQPPREGVILEVVESPTGPRYTVRWDDGHETTFWPHAGAVRIEARREPQTVRG